MNTRKLLVSVLMFVCVLLSACASTTATPAAPSAIPPTAIPPTAVPTASPVQEGTTFSSNTFDLPISFSFDPQWKVEDSADHIYLIKSNLDLVDIGFIKVKSYQIASPAAPYSVMPFPEDFDAFINAHGLFQVVATQLVVVGGFQGIQIDAIATAACGQKTSWILKNTGDGWDCFEGMYLRFIYFADIHGERLLIFNSSGGTALEAAEYFEHGIEESQKILATVVFTEPKTFSPEKFKLPMSLDFNSDWQIGYDLPGKFAIDNSHGFGLSFYVATDAKLIDPIDGHLIPFPEDFLSWIKSDPDFDAIKSTPVIVAGIEGLQIDATPVWKSTTAKLKAFLSLSGDISLNLSHGQPDGENIVTDPEDWRFILLDNVNGERMLIILINQKGHSFEDAIGQSQKVLDTVRFVKP